MKIRITALFFTLFFIFTVNPSFSKKKPELPLNPLLFRNLGPAVGGGRVTSVVGIPGESSIYYVGTAAGGVFKTADGGVTWNPIFEKEKTGSIGAIALSPSNPNEVWVGTGEANLRNDISAGKGVYFSPDGGKHWKFKGLSGVGQISRIFVDPGNSNRVFVAAVGHAWKPTADRGVYRTTDKGKSWKKILFVDDKTGCSDFVMSPGNANVLFAAMWSVVRYPWILENGGKSGGIYRSIDSGNTWQKLKEGVPHRAVGRIALAISKSNPNHVYALVESKKGLLWDSLDNGDHWQLVSNNHALDVRPFYFSRMEVSPDNENEIYFLSYTIMKSIDGGKTAKNVAKKIHSDHHAIWIDPLNPKRIIEGNDGGVYLSLDGGENWRYMDNLPIEQFYSISIDNRNPYHICGGLQDNGSWCGPSRNLFGKKITGMDWIPTDDSDGEYVVPSPLNPDIIYEDFQGGAFEKFDQKTRTREFLSPYLHDESEMAPSELKYRFNWTAPIAVDPAGNVYLGGNVLFKSPDGGTHWSAISPDLTRNDKTKQLTSGGPVEYDISGAENYDTILTISVSPVNPEVIWVGTDDGLVQVTEDGGKHWNQVTPPNVPPWGMVTVEASPFSASSALVAIDLHKLDDNKPYLFKTADSGKSWTSIAGGLPQDQPVHVGIEDPNKAGFLFAGTEAGIYDSPDDGGTWEKAGSNFPATPVYDLKIARTTHDLVAGTHGRGIFVLDNMIPLEDLTPEIKKEPLHLFPMLPATLFHESGLEDSENPAEFAAPNPPDGLMIDLWVNPKSVPLKQKKPLHISITDQNGKKVRTLKEPVKKGLNRIVWDLRYDPPAKLKISGGEEEADEFFRPKGPRALPGKYTVRLSLGGITRAEVSEIKMDPRYKPDTALLEQDLRETLKVRDAISTLNKMLNKIYSLMDQIALIQKELGKNAKYKTNLQQLADLSKKLTSLRDELYNPKRQRKAIEDDIHYLARLHGRFMGTLFFLQSFFNEPPNPAAEQFASDEMSELNRAVSTFQGLLQKEIPSYNAAARIAGIPTLYP